VKTKLLIKYSVRAVMIVIFDKNYAVVKTMPKILAFLLAVIIFIVL
jgi:hypothetical protein